MDLHQCYLIREQTAQSILFLYLGVPTFTQGTPPCNPLVEFQRAATGDARSLG